MQTAYLPVCGVTVSTKDYPNSLAVMIPFHCLVLPALGAGDSVTC